ncbi:MAG: hypothetical protein ACE5J2_07910 [Nitrososphaerales archaeon]
MSSVDASTIIALVPTLIGLWIIVSVPVYISAKIVTGGRAKFIQAMGATILGPLAYAGMLFASILALGPIAGGITTLPALVLALIVWFWVYKASFKTGWLAAIGIAILAFVVFIVASFIIGIAMLAIMPESPPPALPTPLQPV